MTAKRRQSASGKRRSKKNEEKFDEGEYEVETILDDRMYIDGTKDYLIHWENYPIEESTWQPETDLCCAALLRQFKKSRENQVTPIDSVINIVNLNDGSLLARVIHGDGEESWRHECNLIPDLITTYLDKVAVETLEGKGENRNDENVNTKKYDVDVEDEERRKSKEEDSLMDDDMDLDIPKNTTKLNKRKHIELDDSDNDAVDVNSERMKNERSSDIDEEIKSKKAKGEIVNEQRSKKNLLVEHDEMKEETVANKGVPEAKMDEKIAEHPSIISCVWRVNEMAILSNGRKVFWVDHRIDELHINGRDWVDQDELTIQNCSTVLLCDLHWSMKIETEVAERSGADCTRLNQLLTELLAFMAPWLEGSSDKGQKIQKKSAVVPLETPSEVLAIFDLHTLSDGRRVFSVLHEDQSLSTMDYDLVKKQYPNKVIDYYEDNTPDQDKSNTSSRIEDTSGEQAAATPKETVPLKFATVADLLAGDNISNELISAPGHVSVDKKEDFKIEEARGANETQTIRDILQMATSEIAEGIGAGNIQQANETVSTGVLHELPIDVLGDEIVID